MILVKFLENIKTQKTKEGFFYGSWNTPVIHVGFGFVTTISTQSIYIQDTLKKELINSLTHRRL